MNIDDEFRERERVRETSTVEGGTNERDELEHVSKDAGRKSHERNREEGRIEQELERNQEIEGRWLLMLVRVLSVIHEVRDSFLSSLRGSFLFSPCPSLSLIYLKQLEQMIYCCYRWRWGVSSWLRCRKTSLSVSLPCLLKIRVRDDDVQRG